MSALLYVAILENFNAHVVDDLFTPVMNCCVAPSTSFVHLTSSNHLLLKRASMNSTRSFSNIDISISQCNETRFFLSGKTLK